MTSYQSPPNEPAGKQRHPDALATRGRRQVHAGCHADLRQASAT